MFPLSPPASYSPPISYSPVATDTAAYSSSLSARARRFLVPSAERVVGASPFELGALPLDAGLPFEAGLPLDAGFSFEFGALPFDAGFSLDAGAFFLV